MSQRTLGSLLAVLAAVLFGSAYVATAFQLRSFTPLAGGLWRGALAAIALGGWLAIGGVIVDARRAPRPDRAASATVGRTGRLLRLVALGLAGGLVFVVAMNLAVATAGATVTAFVAGLYAVLAAVLASPLLGEPLDRRAAAGFAIALVGTVLLARLDPTASSAPGIAAGLVGAVSYALFLVLSRRWSGPLGLSPTRVSLANNVLTALGLGALLSVAAPATIVPSAPRVEALVALAWLAFVAVVAPVLVVEAVRRIDAKVSSAFLLVNPITAAVLSAVLLAERPAPLQVVGGLLVLVGIALGTGLPELVAEAVADRVAARPDA